MLECPPKIQHEVALLLTTSKRQPGCSLTLFTPTMSVQSLSPGLLLLLLPGALWERAMPPAHSACFSCTMKTASGVVHPAAQIAELRSGNKLLTAVTTAPSTTSAEQPALKACEASSRGRSTQLDASQQKSCAAAVWCCCALWWLCVCVTPAHLCHSHVWRRCDAVAAAVAERCHVCCVSARRHSGNSLKRMVHGGNLLKHLRLHASGRHIFVVVFCVC